VAHTTKNIQAKIILDNEKKISCTINMAGYDRFSDFIENEKSDHLKLTDVTLDGHNYDFLLLNKKRIIGYYDLMGE
jgi:hypothetical protein